MPIYSDIPEDFYPRPSDVNAPLRSTIGIGPRGAAGHSITADVVDTDPYGYFRVQFKDAKTGEVLVTTPNLDVGSRFFVCSLPFDGDVSEGTPCSATVSSFTTLQASSDRGAIRVGDLVFFTARTHDETFVTLDTVGIGVVNSVVDTSVTFIVTNIMSARVADGGITTDMLANLCVTTAKIADGAITNAKIADNAVDEDQIAASAVTTDKIDNGAVITAKLHDEAVTNAKLGNSSVTNAKIANGEVITSKLANSAVTEEKIGSDAVTTSKINDSAVTSQKLAPGSVTPEKFNANVRSFIDDLTQEEVASWIESHVEYIIPSDEQAETVITEWLEEHPEATTTVRDGAVTDDKLARVGIESLVATRMTEFQVSPGTTHSSLLDAINYLDIKQGEVYTIMLETSSNSTSGIMTQAFQTDKPQTGGGTSIAAALGYSKKTAAFDIKSIGVYCNNTTEDPIKIRLIVAQPRQPFLEMLFGSPLDTYINQEPHYALIQNGENDLDSFDENGRWYMLNGTYENMPDNYLSISDRFLLENVVIGKNPLQCAQTLNQPGAGITWKRFLGYQYTHASDWQAGNPALFISGALDANTLDSVGTYVFTISSNKTNLPPYVPNTLAFLEVFISVAQFDVVQRLTIQERGITYVRGKHDDTWSNWEVVGAQIYPAMIRNTTVDLNELTAPAAYSFATDVTILNAPETLPESVYTLVVTSLDTTNDGDHTPRTQLLTNVRTGDAWLRYLTGSTQFYTWKRVTPKYAAAPSLSIYFTNPMPLKIKFETAQNRTYHQDIVVYNNHIFDMDTGIVSVDGGTPFAISNGHGNNANFGTTLHGDFPYLYCASFSRNNCSLFVNQVTTTSATLVRTIEFSSLTGNLNAVVDETNDLIYILLNTSETTQEGVIDFIVASLTDGTIISRKTLPYTIPVVQGMHFANGAIYVTHGGSAPYTENHIKILNTAGDIIADTEDISNIVEIEGISISDGKLYVAGYTKIFTSEDW